MSDSFPVTDPTHEPVPAKPLDVRLVQQITFQSALPKASSSGSAVLEPPPVDIHWAEAAGPHQAWRGTQLLPHRWQWEMPDVLLAEYRAWCRPERVPRERLDAVTAAAAIPTLRMFVGALRRHLYHHEGVAWIRWPKEAVSGEHSSAAGESHHAPASPSGESEDEQELRRALYATIGLLLDEPVTTYGLLFEVRDRGGSHIRESIPVSMTRADTGFHTDSSARGTSVDLVGLLCEEAGASGGDSLVSNAWAVHDVLRKSAPEALALMYCDYFRDVVTPGSDKADEVVRRNCFPIFARDTEGSVRFRYMRYWIERAHQRLGEPLSPSQLCAFDILDDLLARPEHTLRFRLGGGDMLWVNNARLAHSRTAYEESPGRSRRLQRMWLTRANRPEV